MLSLIAWSGGRIVAAFGTRRPTLPVRAYSSTGRPASIHPVMPPHTLTRRVKPWASSTLPTRLERGPPRQMSAMGRSRGSSPSRCGHLAHGDVDGAGGVAFRPLDRLAHVEEHEVALGVAPAGHLGGGEVRQLADGQARLPHRGRPDHVAGHRAVEPEPRERAERADRLRLGVGQQHQRPAGLARTSSPARRTGARRPRRSGCRRRGPRRRRGGPGCPPASPRTRAGPRGRRAAGVGGARRAIRGGPLPGGGSCRRSRGGATRRLTEAPSTSPTKIVWSPPAYLWTTRHSSDATASSRSGTRPRPSRNATPTNLSPPVVAKRRERCSWLLLSMLTANQSACSNAG